MQPLTLCGGMTVWFRMSDCGDRQPCRGKKPNPEGSITFSDTCANPIPLKVTFINGY